MRYFKLFFLITGVVICLAFAGSDVGAIEFTINYGTGFDTTDKQEALQYAADIWGSILTESYTGETITINASFDSTLPSNALASTNPYSAEFDRGLNHDLGTFFGSDFYYYPTALANHLDGQDRNGATNPEIYMSFNPDPQSASGDTPWDFGIDGVTDAGHFDFVTNALHEITHGLGMLSGMNGDGSLDFVIPPGGDFAGSPTGYIYDAFVFDETSGTPLAFNLTELERADLLAYGDLRFVGASATAANGGVTPSLFVPTTPPGFRPGSSVVHLDPLDHHGDLMGPNLGVALANHTPSAIDIGILRGVGWTTEQDTTAPVPEPATILLLSSGLAGLIFGRRRFRRS